MNVVKKPARQLIQRLKASVAQWRRHLASQRADQRLWKLAKSDPRLMADLQAAKLNQEGDVKAVVAWGDILVKSRPSMARDYTNGYGDV